MKNIIGGNIARFRKEKKLTQEALAEQLHVSFQAVSKWETGQTTPDIHILTQLAAILETSIDSLAGYAHTRIVSPYQEWYRSEEYYWGTEPSSMCLEVLRLLPPTRPLRLLDIACGEGKDAVFMARCGYQVSAFDISQAGVDKTLRLAEKAGVHVDAFCADINDYRLMQDYDVLFCSGALHYIRPELRGEIFANFQSHTAPNGLNAMNVFVQKSFLAPPPEQEISYDWRSGELFTLYHDWQLEMCDEIIFDCDSSGIPHKHAMAKMIARKIR